MQLIDMKQRVAMCVECFSNSSYTTLYRAVRSKLRMVKLFVPHSLWQFFSSEKTLLSKCLCLCVHVIVYTTLECFEQLRLRIMHFVG